MQRRCHHILLSSFDNFKLQRQFLKHFNVSSAVFVYLYILLVVSYMNWQRLSVRLQVTKAKRDERPVSAQPEVIAPDVYAAIQRSESRQAKQLQDILARSPFKVGPNEP